MNRLNANVTERTQAQTVASGNAGHRVAKIALIAVVAMLLLAALMATVGVTSAYFTTYASAKGSIPIILQEETQITEDLDGNTKVVTIENGENSRPVFVRVKAFSGSTYPLEFSGSSWVLGDDGYYYYSNADKSLKVLDPGSKTDNGNELRVSIQFPKDSVDGDNFNVVVIYETTPVLYNADGTTYADWTVILDNGDVRPEGGDRQ